MARALLYPSCFLVLSENSKPPKISSPSRFASYWGINKTPHQRHHRHTVPKCTTCRGCSAAPARRVVPITLPPLRRLSSPLLSVIPAARGGELKRSAPRSRLTPLSSPLLSSLPLALPSSCVGSKYQTNLPSPSGRRARGASFFGALRRGPFLLSEIIRLDVFASPSLSPLPSRLVSCVTACSLSFLVRSSRCLCQRSPLPVPALLPFLV